MPIPKQVQVGPFTYSVTVDQAAIDRAGQEMSNIPWATTEHRKGKMVVSPGLEANQERDTMLHEVLHACIHAIGLNAYQKKDEQEQLVRSLTPILLDTLRRNPDLVEYLLEA